MRTISNISLSIVFDINYKDNMADHAREADLKAGDETLEGNWVMVSNI